MPDRTNRILAGALALQWCSMVIAPTHADDRPSPAHGRSRLSFNADWRFDRFGPMPDGTQRDEPAGLEDPALDDSDWRRLDLPHDWGIEGPFRNDLPNRTGKLPWAGIGWYRKRFATPPMDSSGGRVWLEIDGAMSRATVYCNGRSVGGWPYGYASFRVDLTDHLRPEGDNVLAVRLDNPPDSSRWYPGGGLYRNTWLVTAGPVHFEPGGVFVTTPVVRDDAARVRVRYRVTNTGDQPVDARIEGRVFLLGVGGRDARGPAAQAPPTQLTIPARSAAQADVEFTLDQPRRWDIDAPHLYQLASTIGVGERVTDTLETTFGVRTAAFDPDRGFLLNGRVVELQGVCDHHDLGPLGAAFHPRAMERKFEILRAMGANALRTAHNPPAPELLDLADRMGFLIVNEAFDVWRMRKVANDYHTLFDEWHERDLRAWVRRDRNHPSVILWSTGNEVEEQRHVFAFKLSRELAAIVGEEDPTRPVTVACNFPDAGFNGFQTTMDVFGFNYRIHRYAEFPKANPTLPFFGSETSSCVSSRDEYFFPVSDEKDQGFHQFQVSSYDLYAPPWGCTPDEQFAVLDAVPAAAGEFVWTGFDYLGEPTPYNNDESNLLNFADEEGKQRVRQMMQRHGGRPPSRSSYFGILDLCGFPKDRFYLYQSRWRPDLPMAHILPHWNWPDRVGQVTPVHVYTSGDEAELFLNGRSLGRRTKGPQTYRLRWDDVVYEPGELRVVAYKNAQPWATARRSTTGPASTLRLDADRDRLDADGRDLGFVTLAIVDQHGQVVPTADHEITVEIDGPARLIAMGSGDPTSHEPFQASRRRAFHGLCLAILQTVAHQTGPITITARADDLPPASLRVHAQPPTAPRDYDPPSGQSSPAPSQPDRRR